MQISASSSPYCKNSPINKRAMCYFSHIAIYLIPLVLWGLLLGGCASESVYRGGVGAFSDYEALALYRARESANDHGRNGIDSAVFADVFTQGRKPSASAQLPPLSHTSLEISAPPNPANALGFSGTHSSLLHGMRESEAIQRATMRPYKIAGKWYHPTRVKLGKRIDGIASWYGPNFHAKATSNGETYNMHAHTAASKTLPMNTMVKVLNKENGKSTIVRINDRGPFVAGRIIDLSNIAAKDIDMVQKGTAKVRIEVIGFAGKIDARYQNSLRVASEEIQDEFEIDSTHTEKERSIDGGAFSLQLGVFSKQEGAQTLQKQYQAKHKGYDVNIEHDKAHANSTKSDAQESSSKGVYRVLLKGFQSEEEALDFATSHKLSPIILRD